jgi:nitrate/TMAO reductase-like tetraheme cytochrome c subunit
LKLKRSPILSLFKDPKTRPKAVIWSSILVLSLASFAVAIGVIATSTRMFCAESCHKVQDDAIASYKASAHANISCMACHEPVNANPLQFAKAKLKSAGEVVPTVMNTYSFPINKGSAYALNAKEMGSKQCTQCHGTNRKVTPVVGLKIDHAVHAKEGVTCTSCHNRAGHDESALKLSLEGNSKHEDFTEMDACFRCHGLEGEHEAPGECAVCHTPGFELVPETHKSGRWLAGEHSEAAKESLREYGAATVEAEELAKEGVAERLAKPVEHCSTCHKKSYCDGCHDKLADKLVKADAPQ